MLRACITRPKSEQERSSESQLKTIGGMEMNSDLSFSFVSRIHILNTHIYVYNERMFSKQYETVVGCGANTVTDALIYILM